MKLWKTGWVTTSCLFGYAIADPPEQQIIHCNDGEEPQMRIRIEKSRFEFAFDRKISDFEFRQRPIPAWDIHWFSLVYFQYFILCYMAHIIWAIWYWPHKVHLYDMIHVLSQN